MAFTHGVRFKIPLTPFDFAQGRLRQALYPKPYWMIWINEQVPINSLSASGGRAGVGGFQMNLYLLIHPYTPLAFRSY